MQPHLSDLNVAVHCQYFAEACIQVPAIQKDAIYPEGESRRRRKPTEIPPGTVTLVVRNVPWAFTQEALLEVWPHVDNYDFLFLPSDETGARTTSYAFVNFVSSEKALEFTDKWHGRFLPHHTVPKSLNIAVANTQGLWMNVARMTKEEIDSMAAHDNLPVTFCRNIRIDYRVMYLAMGISSGAGKKEWPVQEDGSQSPTTACPSDEDGSQCSTYTWPTGHEEVDLPSLGGFGEIVSV
mmetsp:Transcript_13420/g.42487  ORF Transcript_13420/g.42487 Transcript_13420/m.42487 type:complete len:238 (-) Transcript_13420:327-1040(-)